MQRLLNRSVCAIGLTLSMAGATYSQELGTRPIRIVTGSAGGSSDFVARQLAQALTASAGWQVIVDNRPAVQQTDIVSKAPPDGHTLVLAGGPLWILPLLQQVAYDPVKDFAPVSLIEASVSVVSVHPSLPVKSVKELIALAKSRPGELNYASSGNGTTSHLATELFDSMSRIKMVHVPYKGSGPALGAILGGQVQVFLVSAPAAAPHVKSGRLRTLAVTSLEPSALAPELPTVAATVPGYEAVGISGLFAPAKTPDAVIKRLYDETLRFLRTSEAKATFLRNGSEIVGGSPDQLAAAMKKEMDRLGRVIKENGIRLD